MERWSNDASITERQYDYVWNGKSPESSPKLFQKTIRGVKNSKVDQNFDHCFFIIFFCNVYFQL